MGSFLLKMNRRAVITTAAAASVGVLAVAGVGVSQAHHTVTLRVDGVERIVSGFYPDVSSVLTAAEINLDEYDQVEPGLQSKLDDGATISVERAQPFTVRSTDGTDVHWAAGVSLDDIYDELNSDKPVEAITVSRSVTRTALPLTQAAREVTVRVNGKEQQVPTRGGETVGQILQAAGVDASPMDSIFAVPGEQGLAIEVTTETRKITSKKEDIPFEVQYVDDPELEQGVEEVTQVGQNGLRVIRTYEQVVAGKPRVSAVLSNVVSVQPVAQVVAVGTKEPAPTVSAATGAAGTDVSGVQVSNGDVWAALAQCESGGNPAANTGNGYYGLYQFSLGTWQSVGGVGLPSDASAAEQTQRAQILQQRSGWGQWPACAASLGLL
ncbi:transglycosylase family protein [Scrofimicrobium sp. R131]|uniref:Transglycosylase family protein n=1 Tax=Scrofimicrobium appendicitidis TaxID=3079930 RepID=A0AAU7V8H5_9ACTO